MSKTKPTVVWFQAITCNGNTHSLLSSNTNKFELFLDNLQPDIEIRDSLGPTTYPQGTSQHTLPWLFPAKNP